MKLQVQAKAWTPARHSSDPEATLVTFGEHVLLRNEKITDWQSQATAIVTRSVSEDEAAIQGIPRSRCGLVSEPPTLILKLDAALAIQGHCRCFHILPPLLIEVSTSGWQRRVRQTNPDDCGK